MFIKRVQPTAPRRTLRRSNSSDSNSQDRSTPVAVRKNLPVRPVQRSPSSGSECDDDNSVSLSGDTSRLAKGQVSVSRISTEMDDDADAFQVKKSKLSRQMMACKAPVLKRGGLNSNRSDRKAVRKAWKCEIVDEDDPSPIPEAVRIEETEISAAVGDTSEIVGGDNMSSDSEPDCKAGAAARIARARRAAAREIYGNAADAGGVPDHQADYIPMVPLKVREAETRCTPEDLRSVGSPFESISTVHSQALVAGTVVAPHDETDVAGEWALQQMRVGLHRRHGITPQPELVDVGSAFVKPSERDDLPLPPSKRVKARFGENGNAKMESPVQAMATLRETMQKLESSIDERDKRESELESQRSEATEGLAGVDVQFRGLDKKLRTVQKLEEFAWGLGGLLDEKMPKLRQAAETLAKMEQHYVSKMRGRRTRDIAHDVMHGGASLSMPLVDDDDKDPEDVRLAEERRLGRRKRRRDRVALSNATLQEGWDTSSSSEEDGLNELAKDRSAFCAAVHKQILGDVSEAFSMAESVLKPVRTAKQDLREEYVQAFVSMSLPEVLALHIQHSLLWWDPLELCCRQGESHAAEDGNTIENLRWGPSKPITTSQFEGFQWFEELASFSELLGDEDPDNDLVPKLMQRCLFPEVLRRINDCWDVSSLRGSERIVALLDECSLFEIDEAATAYAGLLEAVMRRLENGLVQHAPEVFVANEMLNKWYGSDVRFRLLWRSCKIAKCGLLFEQRFPDEQLSRFVLSSIFATRIAPHLRCPRLCAKELVLIEQFILLLPERWLEHGLPPALVPLREALGPRAPKSPEAAQTAEAAARVLTRMKCHDEAQVLRERL